MKKIWHSFDTAEACADSAAILFAHHRWTWHGIGVPSREHILNKLKVLERIGGECGRLAYRNGRFLHEPSPRSKFVDVCENQASTG